MRTKFPNLRRCYVVTAIGSPILFFVAFICFAGGRYWWAAILCLLAIIFGILFAFRMVGESPPKDRSLESKILRAIFFVAGYLVYAWLLHGIDLSALILKWKAELALLDWQPVIAFAIWTGLAIYKNLRFINELSDEAIFNYLNRGDSEKTH